jgi:GT2 family glycosyltransferase
MKSDQMGAAVERPALDVCVVTYNSERFIADCLASIRRQLENSRIHVIDNASHDGTLEALKRLEVDSLTANDANLKLSSSWNSFLRQARSEFTLVVNPDVVIRDGVFVYAGIRALALDPMAVAGGRVHHCKLGDLASWLPPVDPGDRELFLEKLQASEWLRQSLSENPGADWKTLPFEYLDGCCMLLDREEILALGGFSEDLPLYYNDSELQLRILQSGRHTVSCWESEDGNLDHHLYGSSIRSQAERGWK